MNNIKDSPQSSKPDLPLAAANSRPRRPRLYNTNPRLGPIVRLYVFVLPLTNSDLLKWADDNQLAPEKTDHNRTYLAWKAIFRILPEDCRRHALVNIERGAILNSIVVATNETPEDLERANDKEIIKAVQKAVGVYTPPKWYKPERV
ncbi:hypothetical protein L208DRAFT_1399248 [Tricholoma matsutake]|nr:hypothetical protein L208DRAFT_1399248 [Tricholoma matsutake 945]